MGKISFTKPIFPQTFIDTQTLAKIIICTIGGLPCPLVDIPNLKFKSLWESYRATSLIEYLAVSTCNHLRQHKLPSKHVLFFPLYPEKVLFRRD